MHQIFHVSTKQVLTLQQWCHSLPASRWNHQTLPEKGETLAEKTRSFDLKELQQKQVSTTDS